MKILILAGGLLFSQASFAVHSIKESARVKIIGNRPLLKEYDGGFVPKKRNFKQKSEKGFVQKLSAFVFPIRAIEFNAKLVLNLEDYVKGSCGVCDWAKHYSDVKAGPNATFADKSLLYDEGKTLFNNYLRNINDPAHALPDIGEVPGIDTGTVSTPYNPNNGSSVLVDDINAPSVESANSNLQVPSNEYSNTDPGHSVLENSGPEPSQASTQAGQPAANSQPSTQAGQPSANSQPSTQAGQPAANSQPSTQAGQPAANSQPSTQAGQPAANSQPSTQAGQPAANSQPSTQAGQPSANSQPSNQAGQPAANSQPSTQAGQSAANSQPSTQAGTDSRSVSELQSEAQYNRDAGNIHEQSLGKSNAESVKFDKADADLAKDSGIKTDYKEGQDLTPEQYKEFREKVADGYDQKAEQKLQEQNTDSNQDQLEQPEKSEDEEEETKEQIKKNARDTPGDELPVNDKKGPHSSEVKDGQPKDGVKESPLKAATGGDS